jgi:hypothetical protein
VSAFLSYHSTDVLDFSQTQLSTILVLVKTNPNICGNRKSNQKFTS